MEVAANKTACSEKHTIDGHSPQKNKDDKNLDTTEASLLKSHPCNDSYVI